MSESVSTLEELKARSAAAATARERLTYLFDEGDFTELDPYAVSGGEMSGVVTAYGYVEGDPVYAFSQDVSCKGGAMTRVQADKIAKVYDLAAKTGAPVVGIYDSLGADLNDGFAAMAAYGELLMKASNLSGVVPQIAVVAGVCAGASAMLAETADLTIAAKDSQLYVAVNSDVDDLAANAAENGAVCMCTEDVKSAVAAARDLVIKLPQNNLSPAPVYTFEEPQGAFGSDAKSQAEAVCDADSLTELYACCGSASYTALGSLGGSTVGVVATNKADSGLTADDCSKIARFVRMCDAFALPVITLVDTVGFAADSAAEKAGMVKNMTKLAQAYAEATTVKLAAVTGKAYGPTYIALAGKSANADMVFALPDAVISPLAPLTAVEFLWHDKLKGAADLKAEREKLAGEYCHTQASAAAAAAANCLDGIANAAELRKVLIGAAEIMSGKRVSGLPKKHSNFQL